MGAVVNIGTDRRADAHSALFCGSDLAQEIINEEEINLQTIVDQAVTLIKFVFIFIFHVHWQ
jgi:hypothetical protein